MLKRAVIALLTIVAAASVQAQGGGIDAQLQARVVAIDAEGKESFHSAERAQPGDVIDYRVTYANKTTAVVTGVQATLPIPGDSTVYIRDSAEPATVLASIDGTRFEPVPLRRIVVGADGRSASHDIPLDQYRFLRWNLGDIDAGKSKIVGARVRMTGSAAPVTASEVRP